MMQVVDLPTALAAPGLRLIVTAGLPSPWSQAAVSVFQVKQVPCLLVRTRAIDPAFQQWRGAHNMPAVLLDQQPVRTGWAEILMLAERIAPELSLVPENAERRIRLFGLAHELLGEDGLLWSTRLLAIDEGIRRQGAGGFPLPIARYLGARYGWHPQLDRSALMQRSLQVLALIDAELGARRSVFLMGDALSALDLYLCAAINALVPLPEERCHIDPQFRPAMTWMGEQLGVAITRDMLAHRDYLMQQVLGLPVEL